MEGLWNGNEMIKMMRITVIFVFLGLAQGFILPPKTDQTPWLTRVSYEEKVKHQQDAFEKLQKAYSGINLENIRTKLRTLAGLPTEESKSMNEIKKDVNATYYIGGATILEVNENAGLSQYLSQGDVMLTEEELDHLLPKTSFRQKRSMTSDPSQKWPKEGPKNFTTVPYKFEITYLPEWKPRIQAAIQFIQNNTCVRFRATKKTDKNFIEIINGVGCYSIIGMNGGKQSVSLGGGCMLTTVVIHELYHALGAFHTQNRFDRDTYIYVDSSNIQPDKAYNFRKNNASDENTYGVPYEIVNLMHYFDRGFAINPDYWVLLAHPEYGLYQAGMGGIQAATFYNILQINKHYCQDKCRNSKTKCLNGGMINPNDCKRCICPEPMGGATCNKLKDDVMTFAANTDWTPINIQIGSFAEQTADADINPLQKRYLIQAPVDQKVQLKLHLMQGFSYMETCRGGGLEIKFKKDLRQAGPVFCPGRLVPPSPIVSETNVMYIIIRSNHNYLISKVEFKAV